MFARTLLNVTLLLPVLLDNRLTNTLHGYITKTHKNLLLLFVLYVSAISVISAIFSGNVPKKLRYRL